MLITDEEFNRNRKKDVSDKIEKRKTGWGQADYVSWVNAQILLKENHPKLSIAFEKNADGSPVFTHNGFAFVQPYLTDGEERTPSIFFPVMNNTFNAIEHPNACEINTACQRATAKAIATFTGLGICCFAGEDVPSQASLDNSTTLKNESKTSGFQGESKRPASIHGSPPHPSNVDDWRSYPIKFGKYANQTLGEVSVENPDYIVGYLMGDKFEVKSETFKEACRQATEAIKDGTQEEPPTEEKVEELKKNQNETTEEDDLSEDVPF